MTKIISKLWIGRLYLISLILLCSCQNAFSLAWHKCLVYVNYDQKTDYDYIYISFALYHYSKPDDYNYLTSCDFSYSKDGKTFNKLISVTTKSQNSSDRGAIKVHHKRPGENINLFDHSLSNEGVKMPDYKDLRIIVKATKFTLLNGETYTGAYLCILWKMFKTDKRVNFIEIDGFWFDNEKLQCDRIIEVYPRNQVKSN